jgi:hypothetical protein
MYGRRTARHATMFQSRRLGVAVFHEKGFKNCLKLNFNNFNKFVFNQKYLFSFQVVNFMKEGYANACADDVVSTALDADI